MSNFPSQGRLMNVILGPHVSEKAAMGSELNSQFCFRVATDANKLEIKQAVEGLFGVNVSKVATLNVKGKAKRFGRFMGRRKDWKKAYVTLEAGQDIDFSSLT
ncbi:MAG: 50S ribosomal protein L23 [Immundisolibacteraceae bacterium]|nr:50S ribosomal protein L23 [Immundisolibacteraceae bacterium]